MFNLDRDVYDFSGAIKALKKGYRITREGWNGKGQYIELGTNVSFKDPDGSIINANHEAMGSAVLVFVGTSGMQVGWLASQADILAEDWRVILRDRDVTNSPE